MHGRSWNNLIFSVQKGTFGKIYTARNYRGIYRWNYYSCLDVIASLYILGYRVGLQSLCMPPLCSISKPMFHAATPFLLIVCFDPTWCKIYKLLLGLCSPNLSLLHLTMILKWRSKKRSQRSNHDWQPLIWSLDRVETTLGVLKIFNLLVTRLANSGSARTLILSIISWT